MKKFFLTLLALLVLISGSTAFAQQQSYEADGIYFMGNKDTLAGARDGALQDAKRLALEQAGTFLLSFSQTLNGELSVDKVTSIAAGVIKLDAILSEGAQTANGAITYKVKARFIVDSADLQQKIAELRQSGKLEETIRTIDDLQKRYETLLAENNQLKQQLAQTNDPEAQKKLAGQIETAENQLTATQWFEKGYYATDPASEIDAYSKAVALDPNYIPAYHNRGIVYYNIGQYDLGIADFNKIISIYPQDAIAYTGRATGYLQKKQMDLAMADYNKVIALDPQNPQNYFKRGLVYFINRQFDLAIDDYSRAIALDPQNAQIYSFRAKAYSEKGQPDLAMADYNKTILLDPQNSAFYHDRAFAYMTNQQYGLAIADYTQAIALAPRTAVYYTARGIAYLQLELYDLSLADFNQALTLNPQDDFAREGRSLVLEMM